MTQVSEVRAIDPEDTDTFTAGATELLDKIKALDPKDVQCMMFFGLTKNGNAVGGMLGNDFDIAKMLMSMSEVARNGIAQANSPSNPNNEVVH